MSDPPVYRDALPPGTELFGYTIRRVLGRGGFGTTYHATDQLDQSFALKEYFPRQFAVRQGLDIVASSEVEQENFDDCRARFLAEAKILSLLGKGAGDSSIVRVVTFFEAHGTAYIVMEYLSGEPLDAILKLYPAGVPSDRLEDCFRRVLLALDKVHSAGLVHRDIKPANIFMREDGRPVLIDFGSARDVTRSGDSGYTQIFSGGYAPIEQFSGARQGPFSDIYAVGAVCYRAIGGHLVDSFTRHQALLEQRPDPLPAAAQIGAGRYPVSLLHAIDRALTVNADQRPQTAGELLAIVGAATRPEDATVIASPPRAPPPPSRPFRARSLVFAAVGALAIVAAGSGAWLASHHSGVTEVTAWADALAAPSVDGFEAFVQHYPNSPHRDDAERRLVALQDAAAWHDLEATPSLSGYETYVQRFPAGAHHDEAMKRLAVLKVAAEWRDLRDSGSAASVSEFLERNPNAAMVAEARARLAVLRDQEAVAEWGQLKNSDDPAALRLYLDKYPDGPNAADARQRLELTQRLAANRASIHAEADAWSKVKDSTSAAEVRAFLVKYPDGPNALNAKARLASLGEQKSR